MQRPRPELIANLCWLAAIVAAGLAIALTGGGPLGIGSAVIAAGAALAVSILAMRRRAGKEQAKLAALALAVGDESESHTVESIVASLILRLERAAPFKAAFIDASRPALLGGPDGRIICASEGFLALEPDFEEGASLDSLFGPEFIETGQLIVGGMPFVAQVQTLAGGRALVELTAAGRLVSDDQLAAFGAALEKLDAVRRVAELLLDDGYAEAEAVAPEYLMPLVTRFRSLAEQARADSPRLTALEGKAAAMLRAIDSYRGAVALIAEKVRGGSGAASEAHAALAEGSAHAAAVRNAGSAAQAIAADASSAADRAHRAADGLETVTSEIDRRVSAIEEISFRTNLLALNAAVEAARAGEKGAGFAVVADEVRSLAQGASLTAKDIRVLVGQSRAQAGLGLEAAGQLTKLLASLDGHLRNLSEETAIVGTALQGGSGALQRVEATVAAIAAEASDALRLPARKQPPADADVPQRRAGGLG